MRAVFLGVVCAVVLVLGLGCPSAPVVPQHQAAASAPVAAPVVTVDSGIAQVLITLETMQKQQQATGAAVIETGKVLGSIQSTVQTFGMSPETLVLEKARLAASQETEQRGEARTYAIIAGVLILLALADCLIPDVYKPVAYILALVLIAGSPVIGMIFGLIF